MNENAIVFVIRHVDIVKVRESTLMNNPLRLDILYLLLSGESTATNWSHYIHDLGHNNKTCEGRI